LKLNQYAVTGGIYNDEWRNSLTTIEGNQCDIIPLMSCALNASERL